MKKLLIMTLTLVVTISLPLVAQQIHEDHSVTFRIKAAKAEKVTLTGDWMPAEGWVPGSVTMEQDENGLWTHTSTVLEPEIYGYAFMIDGVRTNDPNNAFVSRDISTNTNILLIPGGQADLYRVNDVAHGSVTRRWYSSTGLDMTRRITIYTPPGYEDSKTDYPVLYLLHGAGGDEEAWMELGRCAQIMDNLIAQGKAEPMIVVMPNGNVSLLAAPGEGKRGYYKPQFMEKGTMNGAYEGAFMDIVNFIEGSYRVKGDKAHRAVAGLSMGGYHSLHISRYYPNTFDYVGLFSPAILPNQNVNSEVYQDIDGTLKTQMENAYKLYWIGIGKTDFLYKNVTAYRDKLEAMGMPHTYVESEGGHIWKNWRVYLSEFAPQLFR
jgi:enterochelin esterase-like enzyme